MTGLRMSKDGANVQMVTTSYAPSTCWIAAHVRSRSSNRWRPSSNPTVWCWWRSPGLSGLTSSSPLPEIISRNRCWTLTARVSRSRPSVWCETFWNRWLFGSSLGHGCLTFAKVIWSAPSTIWMTWYSPSNWIDCFLGFLCNRWERWARWLISNLFHPSFIPSIPPNHSVKVILLPLDGSTTKGQNSGNLRLSIKNLDDKNSLFKKTKKQMILLIEYSDVR